MSEGLQEAICAWPQRERKLGTAGKRAGRRARGGGSGRPCVPHVSLRAQTCRVRLVHGGKSKWRVAVACTAPPPQGPRTLHSWVWG